MTYLKNQSFYGDLDVPDLDRVVKFGDVVEVTDEELAKSLEGVHFVECDADGNEIEKHDDEQDAEHPADPAQSAAPESGDGEGTTTPDAPAEGADGAEEAQA